MKPQLVSDEPDFNRPHTIELDDDDIEFFMQQYGGGDTDPPQPIEHPIVARHPLMNPDFWYFLGSGFFVFMCFTSFIPMNVFEYLLLAALFLNVAGLIANLTRDRQGLIMHQQVHTFIVELPSWGRTFRFGWTPPKAPLCEKVRW